MRKSELGADYEDFSWSRSSPTVSLFDELRINETMALIPEDSITILEVGCGNGTISNRLSSRNRYVCGLDISQEALKHIKVDKILGSVGTLPFKDKSFDLVLCCEVLEHLPFQIYPEALKEIERVAKKYIIVSVPNKQDLRLSSIRCPYCGCIFDTYRHIRSFTPESLNRLFVEFKYQIIKPCGTYKSNPIFINKLAKLLFSAEYPTDAICPQCGYFNSSKDHVSSKISESKVNPKRSFSRFIEKYLPRKNIYRWIIASYNRK